MSLTGLAIITPTMKRTGPVAAPGMARKRGENMSAIAKHTAMVNEVRPVRPPSDTPEALSIYVVVVLVPKTAPATVATASAMSTLLMPSTLPSLSTIPDFTETPTTVPMVSNMSMKRKVNTMATISQDRIWLHSNLQKIGSIEGGVDITPLKLVTPIGIPIRVVAMMPSSMPPLTLRITRTDVIRKPIIDRMTAGSENEPSATEVASLLTMMPADLRPMNAI